MSGDWEEHLCKKALILVEELCFHSSRGYSQNKRCQEFDYLRSGHNRPIDSGKLLTAEIKGRGCLQTGAQVGDVCGQLIALTVLEVWEHLRYWTELGQLRGCSAVLLLGYEKGCVMICAGFQVHGM